MAGKTVDTEALQRASVALQKYIGKIEFSINTLNSAAQDCSDNMGSDVYSQKALEQLEKCITDIQKSITKAEAVRKSISKKKAEIENSSSSF